MPRRPAKKTLNAAVEAMQVYLGCQRERMVRIRDQEKLYGKVLRRVQGISKTTGLSFNNAWGQIENEARRRGIRCPLPGKDI